MSKFNYEFDISKAYEEPSECEGDGMWVVESFAITSDLDDQGDIIENEALDAAAQDLMQRPTVLFNHDQNRPIGRILHAERTPMGLLTKCMISKTEPDIWGKIKDKTIQKTSITGKVLKAKKEKSNLSPDGVVRKISSIRLFEQSFVSVPGNAGARTLTAYISKSLNELDPSDSVFVKEEEPQMADLVPEVTKSEEPNKAEEAPKISSETLQAIVSGTFVPEVKEEVVAVVTPDVVPALEPEPELVLVGVSAEEEGFLDSLNVLLDIVAEKSLLGKEVSAEISGELKKFKEPKKVAPGAEFEVALSKSLTIAKCVEQIDRIIKSTQDIKEQVVAKQARGILMNLISDASVAKAVAGKVSQDPREYLKLIDSVAKESSGKVQQALQSIRDYFGKSLIGNASSSAPQVSEDSELKKALSKTLDKINELEKKLSEKQVEKDPVVIKKSLDGQDSIEKKSDNFLFQGLYKDAVSKSRNKL